MPVDLHLHTTASDGTLNADEVVAAAVKLGLRTIAVTDHDSVDAVATALAAGGRAGLEVFPGIEMSSDIEGRDIHVLGYFIDYQNRRFNRLLAELRHSRLRRAEKMTAKLRRLGLNVTLDDVLAEAEEGALGRAHVAKALLRKGLVPDVQQAFERYLGRQAPAYVEKTAYSVPEIIKLLREVGGVAVLAHPGISRVDAYLDDFIAAGLQGLEAYHSEHTPEQTERYRRLAAAKDLLVTGGSDCHGPGSGRGFLMGGVNVPDSCAVALKKLKEQAS